MAALFVEYPRQLKAEEQRSLNSKHRYIIEERLATELHQSSLIVEFHPIIYHVYYHPYQYVLTISPVEEKDALCDSETQDHHTLHNKLIVNLTSVPILNFTLALDAKSSRGTKIYSWWRVRE